MRRSCFTLALIIGISLLRPGVSDAASSSFSDASSDATPAEWLAGTLTYSLLDPQTLDLSVRNDTSQAAPFDITLLFFNGGSNLSYVELVRAVSSREGDNTAAWRLGYYGYDLKTPFFGDFDYSLRTEPGASADHRIAPGETQQFTLSVQCASYAGCDAGLLDGWSEGSRRSVIAAARFAYGPQGDAGFGGAGSWSQVVPEPNTAALLGLGLLALAGARRRAGRGR